MRYLLPAVGAILFWGCEAPEPREVKSEWRLGADVVEAEVTLSDLQVPRDELNAFDSLGELALEGRKSLPKGPVDIVRFELKEHDGELSLLVAARLSRADFDRCLHAQGSKNDGEDSCGLIPFREGDKMIEVRADWGKDYELVSQAKWPANATLLRFDMKQTTAEKGAVPAGEVYRKYFTDPTAAERAYSWFQAFGKDFGEGKIDPLPDLPAPLRALMRQKVQQEQWALVHQWLDDLGSPYLGANPSTGRPWWTTHWSTDMTSLEPRDRPPPEIQWRLRSIDETFRRVPAGAAQLLTELCEVGWWKEKPDRKRFCELVSTPALEAAHETNPAGADLPGVASRVDSKSGLTFVHLPGGTFHYGCEPQDTQCESDEKPGRSAMVSAFWLAKTTVAVAAYARCVKAGACTAPKMGGKCNWKVGESEKHPINCVDWKQAAAFCRWVGGRLPTAEDWEYAAKGGESRIYPWGDEAPNANRASFDSLRGQTAPVDSYPRWVSKHGLLNMAGNVAEWTASDYDADRKETRGGSWRDKAENLRVSRRGAAVPACTSDERGFRCAR